MKFVPAILVAAHLALLVVWYTMPVAMPTWLVFLPSILIAVYLIGAFAVIIFALIALSYASKRF